jgi:hypothetical protein
VRIASLALIGCVIAFAPGCGRDLVGPTPTPGAIANSAWTDDGIFRYCRMLPSGNGHATMFTTNWLGEPCPVQPNPTPQGAFFGSSNPDSIVFNFNGTALDIRGQLFCSNCPTTMRYTLYDTNGVVFEDKPVVPGVPGPLGDGEDLSFQREDRRPCKKLVITANGPIPPDTWPGGIWAFVHLYYNPSCRGTGLPILDDPAVQHSLNEQYRASAAENLERGGWILQNNSTGERRLVELPPGYQRSVCKVVYPQALPQFPGETIVATWHTHVLPPGTLLDNICPGRAPGERSGNGPSAEYDVPLVKRFNLEAYIIDANEVFPTFPPTGDHAKIKWENECRRV